jgi:release factor glutamine methyltransferase
VTFTGVSAREALDSAVIAIAAAGSSTPRLDAELLLARALGLDRTALFLDPGQVVAGPAVQAFQSFVRRRSAGREPVAYILGSKGFRRLELAVDPRVLIPRPETETLVEAAVAELPHGAAVLDVGTGSGAVALALADERDDLRVTATDISADALEVARGNAARLGLGGRVRFVLADLLDGVDDPPDAVVSNPPYVAEADRAGLAPEITGHEPARALFAGDEGLDVLRRLVGQIAAPTAYVALEVGDGQADAVRALFSAEWSTSTRQDLAGVQRVVVATR